MSTVGLAASALILVQAMTMAAFAVALLILWMTRGSWITVIVILTSTVVALMTVWVSRMIEYHHEQVVKERERIAKVLDKLEGRNR